MMTTSSHRPLTRAAAFALAGICALATLVGVGGAPTSSDPHRRVIVEALGGLDAAADAVVAVGGSVRQALGPFGLLFAEVPATRVGDLGRDARVAAVTPDRPLQVQSDAFGTDAGPAPALEAVGAPAAWAAGATGTGIGIALIDTGVDEHPDLADSVVASFDLSGEGTPDDGYGHGTFLAGVAVGDGTASGGRYSGVAPDAHLVSLKVAGADGATTLSAVLNALVIVERTAQELGVRVVALALSGPAGQARDPLQIALEQLWRQGLFVVVAAGNSGPGAGTVGSPGVAPSLLTLGATDDAGTASRDDDTVPEWSAVGPSPSGVAKPEMVAPGTRIVAARAVGSAIDAAFSHARIEDHYLRGSGTSMSTAVAAGAAALVLQGSPHLGPDELKAHLLGTAAPLPAEDDVAAMGRGSLDAAAAVASAPPAPELAGGPGRQRGRGSVAEHPAGERAATGSAPAPAGWRWADGDFAGWRWADGDFAGWRWAEGDWAGWRWADGQWVGWRWAGDDWAGWRWADGDWTGWRWAGDDWAGWRWAGDDWAGWRWAGGEWTGWRWAGFVGNADSP